MLLFTVMFFPNQQTFAFAVKKGMEVYNVTS